MNWNASENLWNRFSVLPFDLRDQVSSQTAMAGRNLAVTGLYWAFIASRDCERHCLIVPCRSAGSFIRGRARLKEETKKTFTPRSGKRKMFIYLPAPRYYWPFADSSRRRQVPFQLDLVGFYRVALDSIGLIPRYFRVVLGFTRFGPCRIGFHRVFAGGPFRFAVSRILTGLSPRGIS